MLTVLVVLYASAFVTCILSITSPPRCPPWVPVLLLSIAGLLTVLPKG